MIKNSLLRSLLLFSLMALLFSCSSDDDSGSADITIWSGPTMTFSKADGADPTLQANQDRISDLVWITRNNEEGGQIYNAVTETISDKDDSPQGTSWAVGTTADIDNLDFRPFRAAVGTPQEIVGQDLVLLLDEENIAIDIRITNWSSGKQGGFAYERSTP